MQSSSPSPADRWQAGDAYERYMGRWSRRLAPAFLRWLGVPRGRRWLDVGCGTGALTLAILQHAEPAAVTGVDPSEGFLAAAGRELGPGVALHRADAAHLPLPDAAVDCTVSSLVLNFVPDAAAALREMARVTAPGGPVAVAVWDYGGCMDLIRHYWDAARELGLLAPGLDEGERFPICRRDALAAALADAPLRDVGVSALELQTPFADFDDYWLPFLGGQGPAPTHAMGLDDAARSRLREHLRQRVPRQADGQLPMVARAWAARGLVAA